MTDFSDVEAVEKQLRVRAAGDPLEIQTLLAEFNKLPPGHPKKNELLEKILMFNEKHEIR